MKKYRFLPLMFIWFVASIGDLINWYCQIWGQYAEKTPEDTIISYFFMTIMIYVWAKLFDI